jgi:S1-C subfamily serine protease
MHIPRSPLRFVVLARMLLLAAGIGAIFQPSAHAQDLVDLEEQAIRAAVDRIAPSVVRIETIGGLEQVGEVLLGEGPTTGLVVSSDGFIISSAFNFVRLPTSILVLLPGNRRVPAQIVSRDQSRMLVLLKVTSPEPLPVPEPVPVEEVTVGQRAIAVGRALNPERPNLSVGIVSAKQRMYGKAIQTDAKISPSNYGGPLIDLQGRVFGILVPMSADSHNELAGAEWYDGGIGFAVPLADLNRRLERMQRGEDLQPGLLGITLKPGDMYSQPAEIVAAHPKSPVYQAGLRAGDKIVECNGKPIERQVQLKHLLGPLYAGEQVRLVTLRGDQRRELTVELIDKLSPYEHPFLGVLPSRNDSAADRGVGIRYVYPNGSAVKAGLQVGDRILELAGKPVAKASELREMIASLEPAQKVALRYLRGGEEKQVDVELATLPNELPDPQAGNREADPANANPMGDPGVVEIQIPEEPNACVAFVPRTYRREVPHGVVVYLPEPGEFKNDAFIKRWQPLCEKFDLIVVAPRAILPNSWQPTEVGFVRKTIDHILANYSVDRTRVVTYGYQSSGAMAFLTAFRHRDMVRGVVTIDSGAFNRPPDNDPIERLAMVIAVAEKSNLKSRITAGVKALRDLKFPVTMIEQPGEPRDLNDQELMNVAIWVDTLDRI